MRASPSSSMAAPLLLLLGSLLCVSLASAGSIANPNTPLDDTPNPEPMCLLEALTFTNGLVLVGEFVNNRFHYRCDASKLGANLTTQVEPTTMDYGSTAEVTFNGVRYNYRAQVEGISNSGYVTNSPYLKSKPLVFLHDQENIIRIGVGCNLRSRPEPCYFIYEVRCDLTPGAFVVGDPQFVGLRGQSYQVHGVAGEVYNIVSDKDLQYNSRFVFLDQGECPVVNGKKQKGCFSHPGSYLGELGLKTSAGDRIHLLTGSAKDGFTAVKVNGRELSVGETFDLAGNLGSISMNSTHLASMHIGNWDFAFENSDRFVNQRVRVLDARNLRSHGLLGQTWRKTTYPNAIKHIQGTVDDYVIRDQDMFGDNFVYNTFN